ncbi:MAG: hypothetical protein MK316_11900 [Pseudomonadales bacterium]|nr:hypothetical protein [Pseudomonadales bacterium]
MTKEECRDELRKNFFPTAAKEYDVIIGLTVQDEQLRCHVSGEGITFVKADADVNFTFESWNSVSGLLLGDTDPTAAFMAGQFRSDGYLTLLFLILAIFRSPNRPQIPD